MAKVEKKAKTEKKTVKVAKKDPVEFKYGVADLAKKLGIEPASVRVQLRNKDIEKAGKSYGWNDESKFNAVVKALSAKPEKAEKTEKKASKAEAKPAKKVEKKAA